MTATEKNPGAYSLVAYATTATASARIDDSTGRPQASSPARGAWTSPQYSNRGGVDDVRDARQALADSAMLRRDLVAFAGAGARRVNAGIRQRETTTGTDPCTSRLTPG
jgi:hypothetical protein